MSLMATDITSGASTGVLQGEFNRVQVDGVNGLGPLETQIMDIMWSMKSATIPEVYRKLREQNPDVSVENEIKYTTVLTTMTRLVKKQFLNQDRSNITFRYSIAREPEQVAEEQARMVLNTLVTTFGEDRIRKLLEQD
jgi:predicted transcriptional regulator